MNYIELINRFWLMNEVHSFRPNEIALYFYLLKVNNICSWKESFKHNNLKIMAALNIESSKTLNNARNKLQQAGLITFEAKQGNPNVTYSLTSVKITEVEEEVREEVGEEVRAKLGCIKDKLNKTKLNISPLIPQGEILEDFSEKDFKEKTEKIDFDKFLKFLNEKTGRNFKTITQTVKKKYQARLNEGYTKEDILNAVSNAVKDKFHKENGYKYLTPEYFSRSTTIDKHSSVSVLESENSIPKNPNAKFEFKPKQIDVNEIDFSKVDL